MRRRCGLLSNYFEHLLVFVIDVLVCGGDNFDIFSRLTWEMRQSATATDLLVNSSALPLSNTGVDADFSC